jgi:exonuclease III
MTDHGAFVLYNIYAPASNGATSAADKQLFHDCLTQSMNRQRANGKKIVVCGDFNVSRKPIDTHPLNLSIVTSSITSLKPKTLLKHGWMNDINRLWNGVNYNLRYRRDVRKQYTDGPNGVRYEKYRLYCKSVSSDTDNTGDIDNTDDTGDTDKYVKLGTPELNYEYVKNSFLYEADNPHPRLSSLIDAMTNVGGVKWDTKQILSDVSEMVKCDSPYVKSKSNPKMVEWFDSLIKDDGMVDTFRQIYPEAEGRYTCFNQQTNRRYENEGSRIDYILADKDIADYLVIPDNPAENLGTGDPSKLARYLANADKPLAEFANSFDGALLAATFSGGFLPAPMTGGGMSEASSAAILSQFDENRNTGIVYTPPQYSDHLAVTATFRFPADYFPPQPASFGPGTSVTQPHLQQKVGSVPLRKCRFFTLFF